MSATFTPTAGAIALGVATLERLLGSEDERVALKAAELLLRLHPDLKKPKVEDADATKVEPMLAPAVAAPTVASAERPPERVNAPTPPKPVTNLAARQLMLAPLNGPPTPPRSRDPLSSSVLGGSRPLTSFTNLPKASPAALG
jgi:hypothetical protein